MDYEKMQQASFHMMEAFNSFKALMEEFKNDRGLPVDAPVESEDLPELSPMPGSEDSMETMGMEGLEDYDADCNDDFPGRKFFKFEDINAEDPRFAGGMEIGIPYAVAVRNEEGQGMLIPMQNGLLKGLFGGY